jgi:hypothetical protein
MNKSTWTGARQHGRAGSVKLHPRRFVRRGQDGENRGWLDTRRSDDGHGSRARGQPPGTRRSADADSASPFIGACAAWYGPSRCARSITAPQSRPIGCTFHLPTRRGDHGSAPTLGSLLAGRPPRGTLLSDGALVHGAVMSWSCLAPEVKCGHLDDALAPLLLPVVEPTVAAAEGDAAFARARLVRPCGSC